MHLLMRMCNVIGCRVASFVEEYLIMKLYHNIDKLSC